ncbi:uncharacterized protein [Procambarus clarkii]|uniref:uncharacterized protein n=1 Tax=Procambarus clarkii TaxID=6728 RepID=UPI0037443BBA
MLRVFCAEQRAEWDETVYPALFAIQDAVVESLGFSQFQLVYGHEVRSPLSMLKEQLTSGVAMKSVDEYVCKFRERLGNAKKLATEHLRKAQRKMSDWYDRKAIPMEFQVGTRVMVLLPGKRKVTEPRFEGTYRVVKWIGQVSYEISKPDRPRKTQVCHIDRLKPYFQEEGKATIRNGTMRPEGEGGAVMCMRLNQELPEEEGKWPSANATHLSNTESLRSIGEKLQHLKGKQRPN